MPEYNSYFMEKVLETVKLIYSPKVIQETYLFARIIYTFIWHQISPVLYYYFVALQWLLVNGY